ncbi:cohesin subunit SA-2 isoform X2 [Engraulis encrasicolus]|uniref:cohesin subunit SA-2 isoform X2 n=1 Tax=Engraulis encrasicolus TaxID=184585 RepID=UPI002FCEAD58
MSSSENEIVEISSPGSGNRANGGGGNENRQKTVRPKRKASEGLENAKRRHSRSSNGSSGRAENGRPKKSDTKSVTLFEVVTMELPAIQPVVDEWIEAYAVDRDTALLDLISFFIQCSGCKGLVTAEMFQSRDIDVMSKMKEDVDEGSGLQYKRFMAFPWILTVTWPMEKNSGEYPLIITTQYWRRFRSQFCEFVSVLVARCQSCFIFDGYLMSTLISLLTELSDSRLCAFRHTCTLAAVKLLSALVNLCLSVDNSQKLLEVERSKYAASPSPRLERIQRKVQELQEKRMELESMMDAIFKGVFLKRYRDIMGEIRAICMEELTVWMRLYNNMFLNDSYLKYIGWMMHDKQQDVRLKCVSGLQALYQDEELSLKMDLFTIRFKERMISMLLDKDHEVSLQSMKLLICVAKYCDDAFSQDDFKHMFQFVYSSNRPMAAAAGELLYSRLLSEPDLPRMPDFTEGEKYRALTLARVRALMHFSDESELHEHVVYLVDSLWECGGALLRDWDALASLLLHPTPPTASPSAQDQVVSTTELRFVRELLLASVRQAAEGPPQAGRVVGKKPLVMASKEKRSRPDDCAGLTPRLLAVLPKLLAKYSDDVEIMTSLLKIPQYFQTDTYREEHTESLQALLEQMEAALSVHREQAVLEAAARSYLTLGSKDSAWREPVTAAVEQLIQRWNTSLGALLHVALKDGKFTDENGRAAEILSSLKRLTVFHNGLDMSGRGLFDQVYKLLVAETRHGGLPPEVVVEALRCVGLSILWEFHRSGEVEASREAVIRLRTQLRAYCEKCHRCLSHMEQPVREQAFMSLCDMLVAHNYQLLVWEPSSGSPLLLYAPDPKLQKALVTFILDHVFTAPETDGHSSRGGGESRVTGLTSLDTEAGLTRLEDLHKRRSLLAAYCKLITTGILEISMAADIFKQYMKYYNDFGDIIKETLNRTRQMDKIESARTLMLCLQQLYLRLRAEQEGRSSGRRSDVQTYSSIKELARRFSLTFGWDQTKSRESLAMIHRDGIDFVFKGFVQHSDRPVPLNITYLTILSEFSSKLLKPDKKTVFSYLQKYAGEHSVSHREEVWKPLVYYRASLQATAEGDDHVSYISCDSNRPSVSSISRCPSAPRPSSDATGDLKTSTPLPVDSRLRPGQRPPHSSIESQEAEPLPAISEGPQTATDSISQASADLPESFNDEVDVDTI